ncbi:MAG: FHA domain-containing protein, partial [Planctomycetes bacterium]|nr:FHA domain-containing protein [Planctomycetota bacterium]
MRTGVLLLMHGVEPGVWSRQLAPGPQLVGRSHHCHIQIPAPGVSRKHALIEVRPSSMLIGDLGSRNGTFVNDRPVPRDPVTPFT